MTGKTKIEDKISKARIKTSNSKGPSLYVRDDNGLLQNVIYEFNEDGSINWRAMIKEEHLFPNRSWFESRGKDCPRSIDGLADHQLLIKLAGIKELAKLRGFESISYDTVKCDEGHVAVCCTVSFTPNYETGSQSVTFQDMANATLNNTSSFATKFLETIACNRAFVRCVRNFLNVHIVGDDEIDKSDKKSVSSAVSKTNSNPFSPVTTLQKQAESVLGCTDFQDFKSHIREWWRNKVAGVYQNESISKWEDWLDISDKDARILVGVISKS
jgi:hypothetical protein